MQYCQRLELIQLAINIVKYCSQQITSSSPMQDIEYKCSNTDPVTVTDKFIESIIAQKLSAIRPQDGLIGEEGTLRLSRNGLRWVCDPLDGTVNYIYNIPHYCISVSCEQLKSKIWQPIVGVVFDLARQELFTAMHGGGAMMNDQYIQVNNAQRVNDALIATEFSYIHSHRLKQIKAANHILSQAKDIRSSGSSALDLCWVASGRYDAFYEDELQLWDWSAGSLIVQEAGGVISKLGSGVIASATSALHHDLVDILTAPGK